MPFRPLKSSFPTADDVVNAELPRLGEVVLVHMNSYDGRVKQNGMVNREYLRAMLENRNVGLGTLPPAPEYGDRQPVVTRAVMEACNWLEREGYLMPAPPRGDWFSISRKGEELLKRFDRYERWEKLGLDQVKSDLEHTGGVRVVGGGPGVAELAWEWVRLKEGHAALPSGRANSGNGLPLIAHTRIAELAKLPSADLDFRKLVRLCEELNTAYADGLYFATIGRWHPR